MILDALKYMIFYFKGLIITLAAYFRNEIKELIA